MVREGRLTDEEIREDAEITEFWRKITEVAFAEEASAFPEKASARTEQHAVYDKRIQDGWKQNPEFGNALVLALVVGEVNPLADYIASTKPLTEDDRGDLRREYGRERVPTHVTEGFISEAIDTADEFFGTRPDLNEVRRAVAKNPRTTTADR